MPPRTVRDDEPHRRHALLGHDHRGDGGDEQQLDDARLREGHVAPERASRGVGARDGLHRAAMVERPGGGADNRGRSRPDAADAGGDCGRRRRPPVPSPPCGCLACPPGPTSASPSLALVALAFIIVTGAGRAAHRLRPRLLRLADLRGGPARRRRSTYHAMIEFVNRMITGLVSLAVIARRARLAASGCPGAATSPGGRSGWWPASSPRSCSAASSCCSTSRRPFVIGHFLLSIVLVWNAVVLHERAGHDGSPAAAAGAGPRPHARPGCSWSAAAVRAGHRHDRHRHRAPRRRRGRRAPALRHRRGRPHPQRRRLGLPGPRGLDARRAAPPGTPGRGRPPGRGCSSASSCARARSATCSTSPACRRGSWRSTSLGSVARVDRGAALPPRARGPPGRGPARQTDGLMPPSLRPGRRPVRCSPVACRARPRSRSRSRTSTTTPRARRARGSSSSGTTRSTSCRYVTFVLQKLFGYSLEKAEKLMLEVHDEGPGGRVAAAPRRRPSSTCSASTSTACGPPCSRTDVVFRFRRTFAAQGPGPLRGEPRHGRARGHPGGVRGPRLGARRRRRQPGAAPAVPHGPRHRRRRRPASTRTWCTTTCSASRREVLAAVAALDRPRRARPGDPRAVDGRPERRAPRARHRARRGRGRLPRPRARRPHAPDAGRSTSSSAAWSTRPSAPWPLDARVTPSAAAVSGRPGRPARRAAVATVGVVDGAGHASARG